MTCEKCKGKFEGECAYCLARQRQAQGKSESKVIAILDFTEGIVYIRDIPEEMQDAQAEDIAISFEKELHIHIDDCQYMVGNLQVDDNTNN